jgi:hypothetical protein
MMHDTDRCIDCASKIGKGFVANESVDAKQLGEQIHVRFSYEAKKGKTVSATVNGLH